MKLFDYELVFSSVKDPTESQVVRSIAIHLLLLILIMTVNTHIILIITSCKFVRVNFTALLSYRKCNLFLFRPKLKIRPVF